jgi:hypothetical protein
LFEFGISSCRAFIFSLIRSLRRYDDSAQVHHNSLLNVKWKIQKSLTIKLSQLRIATQRTGSTRTKILITVNKKMQNKTRGQNLHAQRDCEPQQPLFSWLCLHACVEASSSQLTHPLHPEHHQQLVLELQLFLGKRWVCYAGQPRTVTFNSCTVDTAQKTSFLG